MKILSVNNMCVFRKSIPFSEVSHRRFNNGNSFCRSEAINVGLGDWFPVLNSTVGLLVALICCWCAVYRRCCCLVGSVLSLLFRSHFCFLFWNRGRISFCGLCGTFEPRVWTRLLVRCGLASWTRLPAERNLIRCLLFVTGSHVRFARRKLARRYFMLLGALTPFSALSLTGHRRK